MAAGEHLSGEASGISPCPASLCLQKPPAPGQHVIFQPWQSQSYKSRLFLSKARNCVNGHANRKRHPWASLAAPRSGMLWVSADVSRSPVPPIRAGLGQRCSSVSLLGSRGDLGSVPLVTASPDLDSAATAEPLGSALPIAPPCTGKGPGEPSWLLLVGPVAIRSQRLLEASGY